MSNTSPFSPLIINIFWHNASEEMYQLGDLLYSFFLRNPENPLDRYLNIPVYLYPYIPSLEELQLEMVAYSANILLVDNKMNLDKAWTAFADKLLSKVSETKEGNHRIFPVAVSEHHLSFSKKLKGINFIRLYEVKEEVRKNYHLLIKLTHEICRMLYQQETDMMGNVTNPPIKLFLSHAKKGGKKLAKKLRKHIHTFTGLDTFFDANNIGTGARFSQELEKNIEQSLLLAIHTDEYSSREWCRREVLLAKKHNRPLVVVNQYEKGEMRTFPYIGNVPHIHYLSKDESKTERQKLLDYIILEALREALKTKHHELSIYCLAQAFDKTIGAILTYPPELISLLQFEESSQQVAVYPDPPLGQEELGLLKQFRPDISFLTPTLLPLLSKKGDIVHTLSQLKVGISLSESDTSEIAWIENRAIQNLMVELCRYLLVSGTTLIYSGDMNYPAKTDTFNFATLLSDLVAKHRHAYDREDNELQAVDNYSSFPYYDLLTEDQRSALQYRVNFMEVKPPDYLGLESRDAAELIKYDSFKAKYAFAKSLSAMRETMMQTAATHAWVILGGKWKGFKGKMPGVLEECLLALQMEKPVYLIGAFGGVAKGVIEALEGQQPPMLHLDFYETAYHSYTYFLKQFNADTRTDEKEQVDYKEIVTYLNSRKNQENYGLNNGLTPSENECLFHTKSEVEIISLILKGLQNIYERSTGTAEQGE